ncbi:MAG: hypothetical protein A2275_10380 [Bacteroidetes bacterium RIFOXYA12_FULL_35_11]|nr:MAG: hypothetical protein A2X01_06825 [Bacteroidetes bacterium GWF2_35_48]OFY73735.1 MAG: hypothetical protein A2275_10380 [Bacteroidetes bacterium RIFOXYA12_FULL_35_11]HBX53099.1 hypothetical protein [Bacteroidales bacterium]
MNTYTTQIKLDKTPLILQGIDKFLGKLVKITITEIMPEKNNQKLLLIEGYKNSKTEDHQIMNDFSNSDFENID